MQKNVVVHLIKGGWLAIIIKFSEIFIIENYSCPPGGTEESSLLQTGTLSRPETTGDETLRKLAEKHKKQIPVSHIQ